MDENLPNAHYRHSGRPPLPPPPRSKEKVFLLGVDAFFLASSLSTTCATHLSTYGTVLVLVGLSVISLVEGFVVRQLMFEFVISFV